MRRRHFIMTAGTTTVLGLAGCLGDDDDDVTDDADDGTDDIDDVENGDDDVENGDDDVENGDPVDPPSGFVDTSSPEAIVTSWYEFDEDAAEGLSHDEMVAVVLEMLHSRSPLVDLFEGLEETDDPEDEDVVDVEVERFELEIVEENLDEERLEQELFHFNLDEETMTLLAEENAVVQADLTTTGEDVEEGAEEVTEHWLVAPEDGDWLVFLPLI